MVLGGLVRFGHEVCPCWILWAPLEVEKVDGGEGGGEVSESRRERGAGASDREGDEFDSSPISLEGRDEGGVFLGLGFKFGFAA